MCTHKLINLFYIFWHLLLDMTRSIFKNILMGNRCERFGIWKEFFGIFCRLYNTRERDFFFIQELKLFAFSLSLSHSSIQQWLSQIESKTFRTSSKIIIIPSRKWNPIKRSSQTISLSIRFQLGGGCMDDPESIDVSKSTQSPFIFVIKGCLMVDSLWAMNSVSIRMQKRCYPTHIAKYRGFWWIILQTKLVQDALKTNRINWRTFV